MTTNDPKQDTKIYGGVEKLIQVGKVESLTINNEETDEERHKRYELRYLSKLVLQLEKTMGVSEYVDLAATTNKLPDDEWGFTELALQKENVSIKNIQEAVEIYQSFILVGDPGAGKTTTLRYLALQAAKNRLKNRQTSPIPVLLYLSEWDSKSTFSEHLYSNWKLLGLDGDPIYLLKSGELFLLLDAINEIGNHEQIISLYEWLESLDSLRNIIITCRNRDYVEDKRKFGKLPAIHIHELNQNKIRQFVTNYLGDKADKFFALLYEGGNGSVPQSTQSHIRMMPNPYKLRSLIYLFELSPSEQLPQNPGVLFYQLTRALWKREEKRGLTNGVSFEELEIAFARLAFKMIDNDMPTDVPEKFALTEIAQSRGKLGIFRKAQAKKLMEVGQNAELIVIHDGKVRFQHQLNLEYFAAVHMWKSDKIFFPRLDITPTNDWFQGKWYQVVIALSGIIAKDDSLPIDDFIHQCASAHPYLAADCIGSGVNVSTDVRQELVVKLTVLENHMSVRTEFGQFAKSGMIQFNVIPHWVHTYTKAVRSVADETCMPILLDALYQGEYSLTVAVSRTLGTMGKLGMTYLLKVLNNEVEADSWFPASAAQGLYAVNDPDCVPELIQLLPNHAAMTMKYYRSNDNIFSTVVPIGDVAAQALERIGTPEALDAVKQWENNRK